MANIRETDLRTRILENCSNASAMTGSRPSRCWMVEKALTDVEVDVYTSMLLDHVRFLRRLYSFL
jgi:hypothetical protein